MKSPAKFDLHHHAVPEFYVEAMHAAGIKALGGFNFPRWTPERSLRAMDALGTERAWLSVPPGVTFDGIPDPPALARRLNDAIAAFVAERPDRFGWFASLPQGDVGACLTELERTDAHEVLLMSNANGVHFGHPDLDPLWKALDERRAVVYVHPHGRPGVPDQGLLDPLYYWQNDTARTVLDFLRAGGHVRFPETRWLLSHAGGPLPVLLDDALHGLGTVRPEIDAELAAWRPRVFLDTASKAYDEQIPAILAFGGPGQVTFGSDFPWAARNAGRMIADAWTRAAERLDLGSQVLDDIFRGNALRLFAREDRPAPRGVPTELSDFAPYAPSRTRVDAIPVSFWDADRNAVRERIVRYNDEAVPDAPAVIDMQQPDFSRAELARARSRGVRCVRIPLDFSGLEGPSDFLDPELMDALADGDEELRFEPRETDGVPLLAERRLDAVLFCAKGFWLQRLGRLDPSRIVLAGTAGIIPYLARPIDILYYLGRGKRGLLAYAWASFVVKRPGGYRWLRRTRRE